MSVTKSVKSYAARLTMSKDDVRALLTKDHVEALGLAKRMHEAKASTMRTSIFKKLKPALAAHSRAEEREVYNPLLKTKSKDSHDIGNEGFVEHSLLDELLKKLQKTSVATDAWKAQAKVLYEMLEHHVQEEHEEMYADLGDQFDADELQAMGQRFLATKQRILKAKR